MLVVVNPGAGYGAPVSYAGGPRIDLPQDSLLTAGTVEEGRGKAPGDGRSDGSTRPEGEPEGGRGTGVRAVPEVSGRKTGVLVVYGPDGSQTVLNPRERPVMFVAVWCHFCAEALKALKGVPLDKRPHLVFTYLRPGDVEKAGEKLGLYGLSDQPYYLLNEPPEAVQGVPSVLTVSGDVVMGQAAVRQFLSRLL
ncbi:hypothetical protein [Thermanaeromonas toyohensis]|uniref:hypothetical protein n=1 Tax=Thermanaeromonas toyohensis TaxID=161154 RepID=UPI0012F4E5F1|nr:hypothetical protein [Thermanaeromonas toyohensis]